jgi:hypothetical protein
LFLGKLTEEHSRGRVETRTVELFEEEEEDNLDTKKEPFAVKESMANSVTQNR